MKIEGIEWKRVTKQETDNLADDEFGIWITNNEPHYFKKAQKFPICFESESLKFEINEGGLVVSEKNDDGIICFLHGKSFPILVKAVEKAKEVMKKNETN